MNGKGEIIIYETKDGKTSIDVKMEGETVWLSQVQIGVLFGVNRPAITKHINNIYKSEELTRSITCSILEQMGNNNQIYSTTYYNLDLILSVGYRVNSINATRFRIWANTILKKYLLQGFALNEKSTAEQLTNLKSMVKILSDSLENKAITDDEAKNILRIIKDYSYGLDTLEKYDLQILEIANTSHRRNHGQFNSQSHQQK